MKYSKLIILLFFSFISCSKTLMKNNSECSIDQEQISRILKEKKCNLQEFIIRNDLNDKLVNNCNGLFFIEVTKWYNVKTKYNYVSVPFLKIGNDYFVNLNNETNEIESQKDFFDFKEKALKSGFSLNTLNQIEIKYKKGIQIFTKGSLF